MSENDPELRTTSPKPSPSRRGLIPVARRLRHDQTEAEARLWHHLRGRRLLGFKFRRQHPIGRHVADFACESARLVIELDGGQHDESLTDAPRTEVIESFGYRVLRFWNHDVLADTDAVLTAIAEHLRLATGR